MVLTGDNRAWVKDAQGNEQPMTNITVRATEYTTPESMPAKLPPTSAFTYCAELSVDNAQSARFDKPIVVYVNNFLGFNVGEIVPVGYYDQDRAVWVPQDNGVVVRLLDTNGDGIVDAYTDGINQYPAPGLTDPNQYRPGSTYWRVEHTHFSVWDYNLAWGFPIDAILPNPPGEPVDDSPPSPPPPDNNMCFNSYMENRSRIFHEDISIPGTDMTLHYASSRVKGYKSVVTIPASGSSVPASLKNIIVKMEIAGRTFETTLPPQPYQKVEFIWDGLDYLGRQYGSAVAYIQIGFVYQAVYWGSVNLVRSFGITGNVVSEITAREEAIAWKNTTITVTRGEVETIAEGWSVSSHHHMNPADPSILFKGDGTIIKNNTRPIFTIAGTGWPYGGDGGPATQAGINKPQGIVVDNIGNIFIADTWNYRVRKIDTNGIITTVAGNGNNSFSGDGGPATQASIGPPYGVAVDDPGNIYIADTWNYRVRKIDTNGIITTVAGNGNNSFSGDGGPAAQAGLGWPSSVAVDTIGNVFIPDNWRVRKVDTSGTISTIAGNGQGGSSGDGGLAIQANLNYPQVVAVDNKGNVFIVEFLQIRKVDASGIITTIAGNGGWSGSGDGNPATQESIIPNGITLDNVGNLYIADTGNRKIRKVDTSGIIMTIAGTGDGGLYYDPSDEGVPATEASLYFPQGVALDSLGNIYIADSNASRIRKVPLPEGIKPYTISGDIIFSDVNGQGYIMDSTGLHKSTIDLATGKTLLTFGYDSAR